ncbi:hypothetical protein KQ929_11995 [Leclercia pneumoniae]|uniref:Glycine-rich domain-containing protein n=1 Tax=Leclercia pneumoniae TaxID=2815358 RepID=A0ABX8JNV3_9ENTR|nr:hypothetical protein JZ655_08515 [Leclercia pneumoniae]QWW78000.1 hypothetical protein KQ929_11995 [Leclercia pneumoniae]
MHRIDTPSAQKDKFGAGKNGFTRGNPQTGTPATDLDDDYFDMLQEELASVVEAAGITLDKTKHDQLLQALPLIAGFGFRSRIIFNVAGVTNWNVPDILKSGKRKALVKVIGAGASGGRLDVGGGGGGGAGGIAEKLLDLTDVDTVTITVGKGGELAMGAPQSPGVGGGSSSFGSYLSATGGGRGATPSGGASGVGSGGDDNSGIGPGTAGSSSGSGYVGGTGGGAGGAGPYHLTLTDGNDAVGPGGGGSGCAKSTASASAKPGKGGDGLIMIMW